MRNIPILYYEYASVSCARKRSYDIAFPTFKVG